MRNKYIRFFKHFEDTIPYNSEIFSEMGYWEDYMNHFMEENPNGKIDFVWLTDGILKEK